jgi:prepilin-type processing-associated H-X9-DG protein
VENIGRGEADKYGARTSFALNAYMHYNFPQDKHPDGARQVYAIDGWWTWFGSLNAAWLFSPRILGTPPDSLAFPNVGGSMVAWRHGKSFGADALFVDGHVTTIIPKPPTSQQDLLYRTVDTTRFFTLMPGESPIRRHAVMWPDGQPELEMENSIPQDQRPTWWRERPYWRFAQQRGAGKQVTPAGDQFHPYAFPNELSAAWKTANSAWRKFPQRSEGRR